MCQGDPAFKTEDGKPMLDHRNCENKFIDKKGQERCCCEAKS